ncbi:MAG: hypothetical protein QOJ54_1059 [Aliidongia sp.]|nr:hypothetical protein [Aliidongia sp.]
MRYRLWRRFAAALILCWIAGLAWFVQGVEQPVGDPDSVTDAVIVLTGGRLRIENGLTLLAQGRAQKLFISGVHQGIDIGAMLRQMPHAPHGLECCIVLGHAADNTRGNALETAEWLRTEGFHSIRLVTANYHMQRALLEFTRALPSGVRIVPHPVFPEGAIPNNLWSLRGTARLILIEYVKYLGALARSTLLPNPAIQGPT